MYMKEKLYKDSGWQASFILSVIIILFASLFPRFILYMMGENGIISSLLLFAVSAVLWFWVKKDWVKRVIALILRCCLIFGIYSIGFMGVIFSGDFYWFFGICIGLIYFIVSLMFLCYRYQGKTKDFEFWRQVLKYLLFSVVYAVGIDFLLLWTGMPLMMYDLL